MAATLSTLTDAQLNFLYDVVNGDVRIQRLNERALVTFDLLNDAGLVNEDPDGDGRLVLSPAAAEHVEQLTANGYFD